MKCLRGKASSSTQPDPNPWYAMSKKINISRSLRTCDISRHCSVEGSDPVGLCPTIWKRIIELRGICWSESNKMKQISLHNQLKIYSQIRHQSSMIQTAILIIIVAIKFGFQAWLPEYRRMISPRWIRDKNELFALVNLIDCLSCDFYTSAAADAL